MMTGDTLAIRIVHGQGGKQRVRGPYPSLTLRAELCMCRSCLLVRPVRGDSGGGGSVEKYSNRLDRIPGPSDLGKPCMPRNAQCKRWRALPALLKRMTPDQISSARAVMSSPRPEDQPAQADKQELEQATDDPFRQGIAAFKVSLRSAPRTPGE